MSHRAHVKEQKEFYASGSHEHLRAREADLYAAKLARRSGMRSSDRVLEVGAGFGRFTFPLLERWLETTRWARPFLPFLLTQGRTSG